MGTTQRSPGTETLPPLVDGQRLDRATFHERYEAMPPDTRAELVGGMVYMSSPLSVGHGERDGELVIWLGHYKRHTPGVRMPLNATVLFEDYGESQPDLQLFITPECGGSVRLEGGYIVGPPELVVEVGKSSRSLDLGPKKADYERAGVREYLFVGVEPDEVRWFVRRAERFEELAPGADGIFRSEVFSGLWLDPSALFAGDLNRVIAILDAGLATPEHAAFVEQLAAARDAAG